MRNFRALGFLVCVLAARTLYADPTAQKWATTALPITYKVFAHSSINSTADFQSSVLPALRSGFNRWTRAAVTCTRWDSRYGGSFSSPSGHDAIALDGQNSVIWLGGSDWVNPTTVLGQTSIWYRPSSGEIFESDMELNNNYQWKVGGSDPGMVDVESIITHEAGHFLGLAHSASPFAIMYASYSIGSIKVDLTSDDRNDVCTMYPSTQTGVQGDLCTQDTNCISPLICRRAAQTVGSRICTISCASDSDCPRGGYTCQPADPSGMACLVPAGSADLCKFCIGSAQCSNGLCLRAGRNMFCSKTCVTPADCGSAFDCVSSSGTPDAGSRFCIPSASTCPTPQCATTADCYQGFACVSGMCQATGNTGDHCEVSIYCGQCNVCVGTSQEAFCRACCAGQGQGGRCNSCTPVSCAGGRCAALQSSTDQVCIPDGGGGGPSIGSVPGADASKTGCGCRGALSSSAGLATVLLLIAARAARRWK